MSTRRPWLLWPLLAVPGALLLAAAARPGADLDALTADSGLWSARFLIVALAVTPLVRLLPGLAPLTPHRRAIGLAAFGHALLHLGFYAATMGDLAAVVDEALLPGIWPGWVALVLLLPLALTSSDAAQRALGAAWKRLQRLAYPAALFTLAHWVIVHDGLIEAVAHVAPLALLELTRLWPRRTLFNQRSLAR